MPLGEVIAIVSLSLALITSVTAGLVYAFKVGGLVSSLTLSVAEAAKGKDAIARVPLLEQRLAQAEEIIDAQGSKISDFPRMRERLDSVTEDVGELREAHLPERVAVVERIQSARGMPATRVLPSGRDPRKEGGD